MKIYKLITSMAVFGSISFYVDLFSQNVMDRSLTTNLLNVRFQDLEKEKIALLQIMRPFSSISLKYTSEWSIDQKTWNRRYTKDEFHWDRRDGNYRHNKIFQYKNKNNETILQVAESTCWNNKTVDFGYTCRGNLDTFQFPVLGKMPFDKNSLVVVGKLKKYPFFPLYHFPNLQYTLNGFDMLITDVLNDSQRIVKVKKQKNLLEIKIAYDRAFPERIDFILEFDLERGVLQKSILNFYSKNNRDLEKSHVIELDEFIDIKGWKIPMRSIHSKRNAEGKTMESIRFVIDRDSFKLNEPIPSEIFMPRIAQPVTIYDETLGITFKSSGIPDSTTEAIAAELDGLLEHELKSSKIKQQLK